MTVICNISSEIVSVSGVKYECVNSAGTFILKNSGAFMPGEVNRPAFEKFCLEKFKKLGNV